MHSLACPHPTRRMAAEWQAIRCNGDAGSSGMGVGVRGLQTGWSQSCLLATRMPHPSVRGDRPFSNARQQQPAWRRAQSSARQLSVRLAQTRVAACAEIPARLPARHSRPTQIPLDSRVVPCRTKRRMSCSCCEQTKAAFRGPASVGALTLHAPAPHPAAEGPD